MDRMKHFEYTYEESCTHHQEPPPSCIMQLDIQAESKIDSEFDVLALLLMIVYFIVVLHYSDIFSQNLYLLFQCTLHNNEQYYNG